MDKVENERIIEFVGTNGWEYRFKNSIMVILKKNGMSKTLSFRLVVSYLYT